MDTDTDGTHPARTRAQLPGGRTAPAPANATPAAEGSGDGPTVDSPRAGSALTPRNDGDEADADDLDLLGPDPSRPKLGRLGALLAAGVVAALAFTGGVLVQKNHDRGLSGAARADMPGPGGQEGAAQRIPGGGAGMPGGYGGTGSGTDSGSRSSGSGKAGSSASSAPGSGGSTTGSGSSGASATPVVVGSIVSVKGSALTVKNFAGRSVTVHVPDDTPVTVPGLSGELRAGTTVSVTGTTAADGSVTAATITVRSAQ